MSVNDIGTPGAALDTPPLTGWQASVRDVLESSDEPISARIAAAIAATGLKGALSFKPADQAGIASGAAAGFTATLPGVAAGHLVLGIINHVGACTGATSEFLSAVWGGCDPLMTTGAQLTTVADAMHQNVFFALATALGNEDITLTYSLAFSNPSFTYSVSGARASIILIAL